MCIVPSLSMSNLERQPSQSNQDHSEQTEDPLSRFQFFTDWIANGARPVDESLDPIPGRQAGKDFMTAWEETFQHGDVKLLGKEYVATVRRELQRLHIVMPRAAEEVMTEVMAKRAKRFVDRMAAEGRVQIAGRWVKQKPPKS